MILRRDLSLPTADVEFLEASYPDWELVREGAAVWLLLPNYPLPAGYTCQVVTAALRIESGYPDTQLDMVYFSPQLVRTDGKVLRATQARMKIDNVLFQRWSRHRTSANPWRPGEDDLQTHMFLVRHWLEREFEND